MRWCVLALLLHGVIGCASQAEQRETLDHALFEFTHGLRWGRGEFVGAYLGAESQQRFAPDGTEAQDVRVTNCQVIGVRSRAADSQEVSLAVDWYRLSRGRVHRTTLRQLWARRQHKWTVISQRTVAGPGLPLFRSPTRDERI